ncbi:hypothetical protein INT44_005659 [Umbelopsis vinacea]|uniref:Mediator of RNA polymerase II transcription subunit 1 n=1 Tax=Umbelopsis vinacea TaxID=44442 RepID=A0A8H7UKY6_9FUNG|nr:hypothetical protein INT44_005659 [Umbelopsis vinacea]
MSKPVEQKANSNLAAITALKTLFEDLSTKWRLAEDNAVLAEDQAGVDTTNLHPFGTVNIDKCRQDFLNLTTAVRTNCSQFESEVISDVTKIGNGAESAFRKHLMHLKEQANFESTVVRVKGNLQQTIRKLSGAVSNTDSTPYSTIKINALRELAEELGLECYLDTSEKPGFESSVTTITAAGNIIVVDIDIDEKGVVLKAKLTYASDIHQNDKVDKIMLENLQLDDLSEFRTNLSVLAFCDKMNTKHKPIDFFIIMKDLTEDLRTIYNQEIVMATNDVAFVLNNGHGIPQMHSAHPGLTIYYWAGPAELLETQWGQLQATIENAEVPSTLENAAKMWITFAESSSIITYPPASKPHYLLSFDDTEENIQAEPNGEHFIILDEPQFNDAAASIRYIKTLPTHPEAVSVPICFVANFEQPIPASEYTCSRLAKLIGLSGINAQQNNGNNATSAEGDACLEALLIEDCATGEQSESKQKGDASNLLGDNMQWNVNIDNMHQQYVYTKSTPIRGKLLHRIPFEHPVQLLNILQILRKQIVFNHLFRSVFNRESMPKETGEQLVKSEISLADLLQDEDDDTNSMSLEVAVLQAPSSIQVTMMAPKSENEIFLLVTFVVNVSDAAPTSPTVSMQKSTSLDVNGEQQMAWNTEIFDQQKMNAVIQQTCSIPLLVRWIWNRMKASSEPYVVASAKKSFARTNSYFDKSDSSNKRLRSLMGGAKSMDLD